MGTELGAVLLVFAAVIAVITGLGLAEKRRYETYLRGRILREYGSFSDKEIPASRAVCIPAYFEKHKNDLSIDGITASDLELDRLFCTMNITYSSAGEEFLYHALRSPLMEEERIRERYEKAKRLCADEKSRIELQMAFARMGKDERYSLYDYLDFADSLKQRRSIAYHPIAPLLLLAAAVLIFVQTGLGVLCLVAVIIFNMGWYFREKAFVQPYVTTLKRVIGEIRGGRRVLALLDGPLLPEAKELKKLLEELSVISRGAGLVFSGDDKSGNPLEIIMDYLNMILHIDLICFYRMYRLLQERKEAIDALHGLLGSIELLIAIGSYTQALSECCEPVFDGKESARAIYHPLIATPVKNDYDLPGCMLLTGSNASGKSTFLKTVALNMLLSQCFGFACATEFHTDIHRIYTSMALRDDLAHSESYFMVEIKAMRRILEAGRRPGAKIACFVDEVLRGTNTVERIAASTRILTYMASEDFMTLAATHDIELCSLLSEDFENYHFEEEIADGDVLFNYRLMKGRASSRNAIKLLSVMGYDEAIVRASEELAAHFIETGSWE